MGLLGGSASSGMHQNYKQNKNLGNRKKPLKDRIKGYETKSNGAKVHDKKMSPEAYAEFHQKLIANKKKDQRRVILAFVVIGITAVIAFSYLKSWLGI